MGAPPSIVLSKGCPNAELSAQVMQNCEELVLKDDGSKCTTQGAIKTAAALLGQRVNEDVTEQDWYTPSDEEKPIKVAIKGGGEVTGKEINALYNALDLYTDDSNIVGNVTCQGCYEQDKIALEARFHDFHIESTVYFVHFVDPEVERVLIANGVGNEFGITTEQLAAVTDIKIWFNRNTYINTINDINYTSVTTLGDSAFLGCSAKGVVHLPKIDLIYGNRSFQDMKYVEEINLPSANFFMNNGFTFIQVFCMGCTSLKRLFLPNVESIGMYFAYNCPNLELVDLRGLKTIVHTSMIFGLCKNAKILLGETPPIIGNGSVSHSDNIPLSIKFILRTENAKNLYLSDENWGQISEDRYIVESSYFV